MLYMSRDTFSEVAQKYVERERWELVRFLQAVDLFRAWSQSRVYRICKNLKRVHWQPGEVVMRQGEPGNSICFIRYGHLSVQKEVELVQSNRWPTGPNKVCVRSNTIAKVLFLMFPLHLHETITIRFRENILGEKFGSTNHSKWQF